MILLDTNVISEIGKPQPDANVLRFLTEQEDRLHLSVITLAELHRGVALLPAGRRRDTLSEWTANALPERFHGRILPLGEDEAAIWGQLMVRSRREGLNLDAMDGLIAATALARKLDLATRNRRHFAELGLRLLDPWTER